MRWLPGFIFLIFAVPIACLSILSRINQALDILESRNPARKTGKQASRQKDLLKQLTGSCRDLNS